MAISPISRRLMERVTPSIVAPLSVPTQPHGSHTAVTRQSHGSHTAATRQPHGSHTAVTRQSLSSHSAVTQQSLSSHPATRQPHGSHTAVTQRTHTAVTQRTHTAVTQHTIQSLSSHTDFTCTEYSSPSPSLRQLPNNTPCNSIQCTAIWQDAAQQQRHAATRESTTLTHSLSGTQIPALVTPPSSLSATAPFNHHHSTALHIQSKTCSLQPPISHTSRHITRNHAHYT